LASDSGALRKVPCKFTCACALHLCKRLAAPAYQLNSITRTAVAPTMNHSQKTSGRPSAHTCGALRVSTSFRNHNACTCYRRGTCPCEQAVNAGTVQYSFGLNAAWRNTHALQRIHQNFSTTLPPGAHREKGMCDSSRTRAFKCTSSYSQVEVISEPDCDAYRKMLWLIAYFPTLAGAAFARPLPMTYYHRPSAIEGSQGTLIPLGSHINGGPMDAPPTDLEQP
jgi:hypothetical protein